MKKLFTLLMMLPLASCTDTAGGGDGLEDIDALVFVRRAYVEADGTHNVAGGSNQTIDYLRYVPGGGLMVLSPPTPSGELTDLTAFCEGVDINGYDLSFDATEVVFSMRHQGCAASDGSSIPGDNRYHLWAGPIDGSTRPAQLTFGDADDVKPIYYPVDGGLRVAFVTNQPYTAMGTRADEYNHSRVVTQMATIDGSTGDADRRLCSQNLSHTADLFSMRDGRIGFSRWEHLGPTNDVKLFAMNPDCTGMVALAGQHGKPGNSLVQVTEERPGVFVGIVTSRMRTIQSGAVFRMDARADDGIDGTHIDEQNVEYDALTPNVPTGEESPATLTGRYRRPFPLGDSGDYLVSWASGDVNDRNEIAGTAPDFGIYVLDPESGERTLVVDAPGFWDVYARPVVSRDVPPVRAASVPGSLDLATAATIGSVSVFETSLDETVRTLGDAHLDGLSLDDALDSAVGVRIIEGFSSEIGPVREFGLTLHEGAAIVGTATVHRDGSWLAEVPPYVPLHLQPVDRYGMAIRNQMTWIQAMPGENRRCGGCHASRTEPVTPNDGATTVAQQVGPDPFAIPIPDRRELPWAGADAGNIQDVINARCSGCHDGGASDPFAGRSYQVDVTTMDGEMLQYTIPYLLLTDDVIDIYYESEVHSYPAAYVTLLYPSAMMGDAVASGDVPPQWVVPGSARESALIRAINVHAAGDDSDWAWPEDEHHVGADAIVGMTAEERQMFIEMADLGGQYWSRQNVDGADSWGSVEY